MPPILSRSLPSLPFTTISSRSTCFTLFISLYLPPSLPLPLSNYHSLSLSPSSKALSLPSLHFFPCCILASAEVHLLPGGCSSCSLCDPPEKKEGIKGKKNMAETKSMKVTVERESVCEPGPLGLAAFAFTVFVLSAHNAGWAPDVVWVGPAMFYGGLVLLLAGMWEFKKNNVFGATGFSTFGGFWMSVGFFIVLKLCGVVPPTINVSDAFGWLLGGLLIFTTYMTITALLVPKAVFVAFFLTEVTIIFLMIGNFLPNPHWVKAGGYMGIITSCSAWYASFAILFNITAQRAIFPLGSPLLTFSSTEGSKADTEPLNGEP